MIDNNVSDLLTTILGIMIFVLFVLIAIFVMLKINERQKEKINKKEEIPSKEKTKSSKTLIAKEYNKQSIMDFMEFDKIEDNMIIQRKGKRYLMVIECQGINYDLMSQPEKVAVEEGFQQFLNTLRHPVQIYIQTRTINLEKSISEYNKKIKLYEDKYNQMYFQYNNAKSNGNYSEAQLEKIYYELTKQRNLLEYGKDLIANTEKMSRNKSILNKKYYIIIPYFSEDAGDGEYDYEEIKGMAFSELYTKAQSTIRTLTSCSISGKILNSEELAELLFMAYNRDEAEVFGIEKAAQARYNELYSTAPDVFEKKIKVLDETINKQAIELANSAIQKVKSRPERIAEEKQNNLEELVRKMAQIVLEENQAYVGPSVAKEAIEEIKNPKKTEGKTDEKIKTKTTRGRKKKTTDQ